jgi:hypothetical protein
MIANYLNAIFFILISSIILILPVDPDKDRKMIRIIGLISSSLLLIIVSLILYKFRSTDFNFIYINNYLYDLIFYELRFSICLNRNSAFFLLFSNLSIFLCLLFIWDQFFLKQYVLILLLLDLSVLFIIDTPF